MTNHLTIRSLYCAFVDMYGSESPRSRFSNLCLALLNQPASLILSFPSSCTFPDIFSPQTRPLLHTPSTPSICPQPSLSKVSIPIPHFHTPPTDLYRPHPQSRPLSRSTHLQLSNPLPRHRRSKSVHLEHHRSQELPLWLSFRCL
jgi:hypothetical protein